MSAHKHVKIDLAKQRDGGVVREGQKVMDRDGTDAWR